MSSRNPTCCGRRCGRSAWRPDVASFERAHYRAMVVQDLAGTPPVAGTWWREYLVGYLAACGVAEDQCRELAAEVAEATAGRAWTHVGTGVMAGLRALAALGLPMGVVSNSDGTVRPNCAASAPVTHPTGHAPEKHRPATPESR